MFLSGANLSNMLADFTEIALIALPMTLIIIAAEIDLSVASVLGASSALMGVLWHMGLPMPLVIAIVLVAGDACRAAQRPRDRALQPAVARGHDRHARAVSRARLRAARRPGHRGFSGVVHGVRHRYARRDLPADAVHPRDTRRDRVHGAAAGDAVRPQPLCDRRESGGRAVLRHRRRADQAQALHALGRDEPRSRASSTRCASRARAATTAKASSCR